MGLQPVCEDDFTGPELLPHWVGGHLNGSTEVRLTVGNGLRFEFTEGTQYASAGIVKRDALHGDFVAALQFEVANPGQGCTFELAAVQVPPPELTELPPAEFSDAHRVYNVHGAPPYVSSEFDENDGWRIGWNWGHRQGARNARGEWVADNTDNRYGKSKFGPVSGAVSGWLQLSRTSGSRWQCHGRLRESDPWNLSGEQSTELMSGPVYLRLVAKHWVKRRLGLQVAPANQIVLSRFTLSA